MIFHRVHRIIYAAVVRLQLNFFFGPNYLPFSHSTAKCIVSGLILLKLFAANKLNTFHFFACLSFVFFWHFIPILLYSCQYWNVVFNSNHSMFFFLAYFTDLSVQYIWLLAITIFTFCMLPSRTDGYTAEAIQRIAITKASKPIYEYAGKECV